ncbi:putative quinol monooxygenase [Parachitinimonas caeni]|uniref:Quinol monooxygenase n=1 Tax=Parachitinimonas caeni TaxID=3031301 RepID=A0ABT7DQT0_9NEIS|nr:putative quinol monooxygenase [Parachitinimonas caeni]MDK2122433.1 putative quinol monooxygenase [Parachitinimonas caeni]
MNALTVVATIIAKPGAEAQVEQALLALIPPTRKEPGFIQYDLHRHIENPGVFVFYENWESRALLEQHLQSPHLAEFIAKTEGLLDTLDIKMMHRIGA